MLVWLTIAARSVSLLKHRGVDVPNKPVLKYREVDVPTKPVLEDKGLVVPNKYCADDIEPLVAAATSAVTLSTVAWGPTSWLGRLDTNTLALNPVVLFRFSPAQ